MSKITNINKVKPPSEFSLAERKIIIEEFLSSSLTKTEIWKKYTGQKEEHGSIIKWMRMLGYSIPINSNKLAVQKPVEMSTESNTIINENLALKEKVKQLEVALIQSELRATAFETMINVAEKELKVSIKKKSFTKQSMK
jgi:hypothetical protein